MKISYRCLIERQEDNKYLVTFPDFEVCMDPRIKSEDDSRVIVIFGLDPEIQKTEGFQGEIYAN